VLIEADADLDWCTDPDKLERALVPLVELKARDDMAVPKLAQERLARELGRIIKGGQRLLPREELAY
jgi:hypothetical protein